MASRQWEPIVADFSDAMKLVHLAMRMDDFDERKIRNQVLEEKRDAYVDELTALAKAVGCNRVGSLRPGIVQKEMVAESDADADSITNTYNYDLAIAIRNIRATVPTANRHVYAKRLLEWHEERSQWKSLQISLWDTGKWRSRALFEFMVKNTDLVKGSVELLPMGGAEPVCDGWTKKGKMRITNKLLDVIANWPPHLNCPHYWQFYPGKVLEEDCAKLWVG